MGLQYLHLRPDEAPPPVGSRPSRAVIVSDVEVTQDWRNRIAQWLLQSGCLYVVAWGVECEVWHDTVDWTNLEAFDFGDIPDEKFVMTTWHPDEPLSEALWFAGQCAFHPHVKLDETAIIHITNEAEEAGMLDAYSESQMIHN